LDLFADDDDVEDEEGNASGVSDGGDDEDVKLSPTQQAVVDAVMRQVGARDRRESSFAFTFVSCYLSAQSEKYMG
jgi:hypothetical protein